MKTRAVEELGDDSFGRESIVIYLYISIFGFDIWIWEGHQG